MQIKLNWEDILSRCEPFISKIKKVSINNQKKNLTASYQDEKENIDLLSAIDAAKKEIETANNRFNNTWDNELISSHIYQMQAAQSRYQYLLRLAKQKNLRNGISPSSNYSNFN